MREEDVNYFIITGIAICAVLLLVFTIWGIKRCVAKCQKKKKLELDFDTKNSTQQLIPPIFYTDEIKDPLLQDDLFDKMIQ